MIRESETFTYAGEKSEDYGIYNVNISQSTGLSEPFASNATLHKISSPRISKNYLQFVERAPIQFSLEFYLDDKWSDENLIKISRWLCQDTYKPMIFSEAPQRIYDCIAVNDASYVHNCLKDGYVQMTFECKDCYSHSAVLGTDEDYDISSGNKTITIQNLGSMDTYPELWISKIGNGALSITNHSDNDNTFSFGEAQRASGILTCSGTVYDGETITINNDVYEIDTGDGTVGTHQTIENGAAKKVDNIKIDMSGESEFAYGTLNFQNGYVEDGETITIGSDTYEFDTDSIYSKNDIPVDISKYAKTASYIYKPLNKYHQFTQIVTIQDTTYRFEQGTTNDIMKVNHNIDIKDKSNYRIINVGDYSEFQESGYVNRRIFHNMYSIEIPDKDHLLLLSKTNSMKEKEDGSQQYEVLSSQAPYTDTNKQEINIYCEENPNIELVGWENDGCVLFVPAEAQNKFKPGAVLELTTKDIMGNNDELIYKGSVFYVGVQKTELANWSWHTGGICKIYLMSYGNGTGGANDPKIENDMNYNSNGDPADLWYTDSPNDPNYKYSSDFVFPCNRIEKSQTRKANTVISAIITHVTTGNSSNTDEHSLPLLPYDLSQAYTVKCGDTIEDTMQNFVDAINGSVTAQQTYSTGTNANKYVTAEKSKDENGNTCVILTSKLAGAQGNNISVKITDTNDSAPKNDKLNGGLGCTQDDAQRELIRAMAKNYQLNPNFSADVDRYYPCSLDGSQIKVTEGTWMLPGEDTGSWQPEKAVKVKAMIAGSRGNNILVASNTAIASWGKDSSGNIIVSLMGGEDPSSIENIINIINNAVQANGAGYSAFVLNSNQIQLQYNQSGEVGNVPVSTTCFNVAFDSYRLNGGLDELQAGELIYVNCSKGEEHIESSFKLPRYNNCNQNYLRLIYGNNVLEVQGTCKLRIYYNYRYR